MAGLDEHLVELVARGVEAGLSRTLLPTAPATDGDQPDLLTAAAAAARFDNLSDQAVYDWMNSGVLPCVQLGRRRFVPRRAIEQLVEQSMAGWTPDEAVRRLKAVS